MSAVAECESIDKSESGMMCCASCGITENNDDVKLKKCTACHFVRYCSVQCQREHRPKHKRDCKKRAAELRDELLFKQPESTHFGDCPICCLPLPLDFKKSSMTSCCSKVICAGCDYANYLREIEGRLEKRCPFCREAPHNSEEERDQRRTKRIEANDPLAMVDLAVQKYQKNDYGSAFEWFNKAAALGDATAHSKLAVMYKRGRGVEEDSRKEMYHLEEAAIGGEPKARFLLGTKELQNGNADRAVKHWIIAATQGIDQSIETLMNVYKAGFVSKEDLAAALRAHKAAVDAWKSPQREAVEEYRREMGKNHL